VKYKVYNSQYYRYFAYSIQMLYIIHCRQLIIWVFLNVRNSSKDFKKACIFKNLLNTVLNWNFSLLRLVCFINCWIQVVFGKVKVSCASDVALKQNLSWLVLCATVCHRVCRIMFILDGSFSAVLKCIKQWIVVGILTPKSETLQSWMVRIGLLWCRYCGHRTMLLGEEIKG